MSPGLLALLARRMIQPHGRCRIHAGLVQQLGAGPGKVPDGQIAHIEAITEDGARIIDVWESTEAYERFMRERLGPVFAAAGMPPLDPPPMLQVHRVFVAEVGPAAP